MQPGMSGVSELLTLLDQAQQAAQQAQRDLAETSYLGTAGGNLVRAVVSGDGELTQVQLDPSVVDPTDIDTLCDLIVAAVRDATSRRDEQCRDTLDDVLGPALAASFAVGTGPQGPTDQPAALPRKDS